MERAEYVWYTKFHSLECVWVRMSVLFQGKLNLFLFMNSKLIIYSGEKVEFSVVHAQLFIISKIKAQDYFLF